MVNIGGDKGQTSWLPKPLGTMRHSPLCDRRTHFAYRVLGVNLLGTPVGHGGLSISDGAPHR